MVKERECLLPGIYVSTEFVSGEGEVGVFLFPLGASLGVWTGEPQVVWSSFPRGSSQSTLLCGELLLVTAVSGSFCRHREPGKSCPGGKLIES